MKKIAKIITGCAVVLVLGGVYVAVKHIDSSSEEETEVITVADIDSEEITGITFSSLNGESLSFQKTEDTWSYEADSAFPVDADKLDSMAGAFSGLEANRKLEDVESLSEYGLDNPKTVINVSRETNDDLTVTVGNANATTGDSYIYLNDDTTVVYTVASTFYDTFSYNLYSLAKGESLPTISSSYVTGIQVTGSESDYILTKSDNSATGWYLTEASGTQIEAEINAVTSQCSSIASLAFEGFVDYNCTELSKYGLDNPKAVLTVDYQEEESEDSESSDSESDETVTVDKQMILYIGNENENSKYYVRMEGSTEVHTISVDTLDAILTIQLADYQDLSLTSTTLNEIDDLIVKVNQQEYTLRREAQEKDSDDEEEETTYQYYVNDNEVEETDFVTFFNDIYGMTAQSKAEETLSVEDESEKIEITYHIIDGTVKTVSFVPYDSSFYLGENDEGEQFLVNKLDVRSVLSDFEKLIS